MAKRPSKRSDPNYVGRGHPPIEHQFKKGVSGNPAGRPKNRHRLMTQVYEELQKPIALPSGNEVMLPRLLVSSLVAQVSRGKQTGPILLALQLIEKAEEQSETEVDEALDTSRRAQLDDALRRIARKRQAAPNNNESGGDE